MKKLILPILLMVSNCPVLANWTAKIGKDPLTDGKQGIASTSPSSKTKIKIICKENEVPQLSITWREPNSAKTITHFQYKVDNEEVIIINVNSVVGDRTTISTGSIMESVLTDFVKKNRVVVKGEGNKYETSPIVFDLKQSAASIKRACSWHPFYQQILNQ